MNEKLIKVYFGQDLLPYKDSERSVHFPIVGGAFLGASNTTKIRFYFDQIGDTSTTYVSVAKLPNGKQGSQVLSKSSDDDGNYAELELSNWYTQAKGDVYIALQGYSGGVEYSYDSETELYEIHGTPIIQTTGSIKLAINYAPIGDSADYNDEFTTYQEILAGLGDKLDKKETSGLFAYTHDGSVQGEIGVSKLSVADYIVQRDGQQIAVPLTPSANDNATSKKYVDDSIASAITSVYKYKGSVATYSDLPSSGLTIGDVYNVEETGDNYAWTGTTWDKLAGDIDLSDYATKDYVDTGLSGKQNTLVNQVNIKSINNQSLLGTGNIDIQGGDGGGTWGTITGDIQDQTDLQNELSGIREIAEGKTSTYSVDTDTSGNSAFKSDNDVITVASFVDINGNTITTSELRTGDLVYTLNTNQEKYKDRWLIDPILGTWGLIEADTPDLSGYATTTDLSESIENLAQPYDNTNTYTIGEIVIHENKLYRCTTAITNAEDWDSTHWEQITVANGFVNLTGTQTISGKKTFTNDVHVGANKKLYLDSDNPNLFGTFTFANGAIESNNTIVPSVNNLRDLGSSSLKWKDLYLSNAIYTSTIKTASGSNFIYYDGNNMAVFSETVRPNQDGTRDLGTSSYHWKDLYLGGNIDFGDGAKIHKDSSNRVAIQYGSNDTIKVGSANTIIANRLDPDNNNSQDIGRDATRWKDGYFAGQVYAQNTFNVINANDITNNTLTQAQYDLITNGKPTLIKGSYDGAVGDIMLPAISSGSNAIWVQHKQGNYIAELASSSPYTFHIRTAGYQRLTLSSIYALNGYVIPTSPGNTGTFNLQMVNGTMAWNEQWYGTQTQYDNLGTYDSNTTYNIIED